MREGKIARRLFKYFRNKKNMSQTEFAKYLGVSQTVISFVESGKRPASGKLIKKLSEKENLTAAELVREMYLEN